MEDQKQLLMAEEAQGYYSYVHENEPRAVFVDTTLGTHLVVVISPLTTVSHLQQQISLEHCNCFPQFGRILIKALSVKLGNINYTLPETGVLKSVFLGLSNRWVVSAEVWKPVSSTMLKRMNHKKDKKEDKIDSDINMQPSVINKPEEIDGTPKDVFQTRNNGQMAITKTGDSGNKYPIRPCTVHHVTNTVKDVQGTGTNLAENVNNEVGVQNFKSPPSSQGKRNKKKKKKNNINGINQSQTATTVKGHEKGDVPSNNGNTIQRSEQKGMVAAAEVTPSQMNNVRESPQQAPLNLEKKIEEDLSVKLDTSKKRKACESEQESQKAAQKLSPLHLNNVPQQLAGESLNFVEKEKKSEEKKSEEAVSPLKLENTAKRRKKNKGKNSSTNQDLSSTRPNDNEKADGTHVPGEPPLPDDTGKPDESVETMSGKLKNSPNRKGGLDEEIKEMASPISAIQSNKSNRKRHKKQPVPSENLSSALRNQHSNESIMEMEAPKNVGDSLTNDALLKSENTTAIHKTNDNDRSSIKTADAVSLSPQNDDSKVMSQDELLSLSDEEKEIQKNMALFLSEMNAKIRETFKATSSDAETQDKSSSRQNQVESDGRRHINAECSLPDDIGRPEGSVEIMNGKLKRPRNSKVVPGKDLSGSAVQEQPDEKTKEEDISVSFIQSDKSKKRTKKEQPASGVDLSSLPVDQHQDENLTKLDVPKNVEQGDDLVATRDADNVKNQKKLIHDEGHQGEMSKIPPLDSDKPRTSKQRSKKLNQLTSVDTPSNGTNLVESKKNRGNVITSEPQKSTSNQRDLAGASCVEDGSKASGANATIEMDFAKRVDNLTVSKSSDAQNQNAVRQAEEVDEFSQAPGLEASAVLNEVGQVEKSQASVHKAKKVDQFSSIDTSSIGKNLAGSKKSRGKEKAEPQKSITDRKHDKSISPLNAKPMSKTVRDAVVPSDDLINNTGKTGVPFASLDDSSQSSEKSGMNARSTVRKVHQVKKAREPSNKLKEDGAVHGQSSHLTSREVSNTSVQKKRGSASSRGIFGDGNSSSSDDDDGIDASNSSTTLPSEESEDESKGVVNSEHGSAKRNGSSNANSSALKLESILRSSSRYKRAKSVAESEPPEFVPDSQADL
ncbi:Extracellular matrix-binding protein ebh [Bienertia sinuspersici]